MFKLLNSESGQIIISIILGFGLACLFRRACKDRSCITYSSPNFEDIKNQIFNFNKKCYKYIKETTTCNKNPVQ